MTDAHTARTIVGIIGNVISFGLFCSPIPTMIKIWKMKSVSEFKPDPYLATVLNCMMWSFYGLPFVHPDSLLVITINGTGLFMELFYVTIFFIFATSAIRRLVIKTKSVKYMPFFLSLASFMNGVVWVIYACLKFDPYILIPNGLGSLSGLAQLILYATYYRTTNWNDEDGDKEKRFTNAEIELDRA
ncbi:hypothetical protein HID58_084734 [Brassica napus]|uniref:Bidirectional sugar transporter SWEET n=1 Tax=Brassica napus TaxID=3708 RepID=A0ABQ7XKU3_BRANA|nr:hypothetical protein HID58_084734 [Brassica napus]